MILLDNGRTRVLRDEVGRQTLQCIRCSACLNVCPVYERTGGHAYGSVYPGPIGAILTPQLRGMDDPVDRALPFASSLCGACYEVGPEVFEALGELVAGGKRLRPAFCIWAYAGSGGTDLAAGLRAAAALEISRGEHTSASVPSSLYTGTRLRSK